MISRSDQAVQSSCVNVSATARISAHPRGQPTSARTRKGEGNRGKNAGEVSFRGWGCFRLDGVKYIN